jgi:hypothetical protein
MHKGRAADMNLTRRGLITGLVAFVAAPAIVRAESLMKIAPRLVEEDVIVDVSHQTGHWISVNPLKHDFHVGDVVTISGVYASHSLERLREFVVTAEALKGHRYLNLYPPIVPVLHANQRYATTDSPAMRWDKVKLVPRWS